METNHYYPFGGVFSTSNVQPYKYNGKELDTMAIPADEMMKGGELTFVMKQQA